jgi:hypothetical protein
MRYFIDVSLLIMIHHLLEGSMSIRYMLLSVILLILGTQALHFCAAAIGKPYKRGWPSTVDLLVLTSSDQLFVSNENIIYYSCKTNYLNEEFNCT